MLDPRALENGLAKFAVESNNGIEGIMNVPPKSTRASARKRRVLIAGVSRSTKIPWPFFRPGHDTIMKGDDNSFETSKISIDS